MANYFDVVDCRTGRVVDTLDYHGARREASRWNNASPTPNSRWRPASSTERIIKYK